MCLYVILQVERNHLLIVRESYSGIHPSNNSHFTCRNYSIIELSSLKTRHAPEVCQVQRKWCYWLTRRCGSEVCLRKSWLSIMRFMFCKHSFVSMPEVSPKVFMCSFHQVPLTATAFLYMQPILCVLSYFESSHLTIQTVTQGYHVRS